MLSSTLAEENSLYDIASDLLNKPVDKIAHFRSGGNSTIYQIQSGNNDYALKCYSLNDGHDRLRRETEGFRFLHFHNVACVPTTISADYDQFCALYEWIDGSHINEPDSTDIDAILSFCSRLFKLGRHESALRLKQASASCFSGKDVVDQMRHRLDQLQQIEALHPQLECFLQLDFFPMLISLEDNARRQYAAGNIQFDDQIDPSIRVLSPSDFGFHNALCRSNGSFVFLDFEYFGWDDPVKLTADVLLHPAMELDDILKQQFLDGIKDLHADQNKEQFSERFSALYPLYGLIWCLIILNPYLPAYGNQQAHNQKSNIDALDKAKKLLKRINDFNEYSRKFI